ncbi:MAG: DUF4139 domain-containing protein [Candidatus Obscuribacterales bacterium]
MTKELKKAGVPLKRVSLYKHGIGYFERRGKVDGPCRVELVCGPDEIDDMLKSLLVLKEGSRIAAITYESATPIAEKLSQFGFDLRVNDGFVKLVAQMKGVPVTILLSGELKVAGKVVGIDTGRKKAEGEIITEEFLVVYTDNRELKRVPVADIISLSIDDRDLAEELKQQLDLLFLSLRKKDQKLLNVEINEKGKSDLTIAYSIPNPIWKTSYRLLFNSDQELLLQGVAIVDNIQDEDWENVDMTLVSAAPISFIQPLYDPIKPLRKTIKAQGVQSSDPFVAERELRVAGMALQQKCADTGSWGAVAELSPAAPGQAVVYGSGSGYGAIGGASGMVDALKSQAIGVEGEQTGELFEYKIKDPVTVPRGSSALIPVVQQIIEGERVSIYKEEQNREFAFAAVRLVNTTGLTLEAGPVTVMESESYAGECLLDVLKPDDKRILPYALDQSVGVVVREDYERKPIWKVRITDGIIACLFKQISKRRFIVENLSSTKKVVYIEHPYKDGWTLTPESQEAEETTRNFYRFRLELDDHSTRELEVETESESAESYSLFNVSHQHNHVQWLLDQNFKDEDFIKLLRGAIGIKAELARLSDEGRRIEAEIAGEENNQNRARENVKTLGANADRFKEAIETSEDRIVELQENLKKVRAEQAARERQLKDLLSTQVESELASEQPASV